MKPIVVTQVRDAQYELRAAAKSLRTAAVYHAGPHIIKALAKTIEAIENTQEFFVMVEEEEGEDE